MIAKQLIDWHLRFISRRPWGWFGLGVYLLAIIAHLAMFAMIPRAGGPVLFRLVLAVNVVAAIGLGALLAGYAATDRRVTDLLTLTGDTNARWMMTQLAVVAARYLVFVAVRLPFLWLAISFGGVPWRGWLWLEAFVFALFFFSFAAGLWTAFNSDARTAQQAFSGSISLIFAACLILSVPRIGMSILSAASYPVPFAWDEFASLVAGLSISGQFLRLMMSANTDGVAPVLALHATLAAWLLWLAARKFHGEPLLAPVKEKAPPTRSIFQPRASHRKRRRWSSDPLADLAFAYHHAGEKSRNRRLLAFAAIGIMGLLIGIFGDFSGTFAIVVLAVPVALLTAANPPATCFQQEIQGETLEGLHLLPLDPLEIFDAWRRGAHRLVPAEALTLAVCFAVIAFASPPAGFPVLLGAYAAVLFLPGLTFVGTLMTLNWRMVPTAAAYCAIIIGGIVGAVVVGIVVWPLLGALTAWLLAYAGRLLLRREIPTWWQRRIQV